MFFFRNECNPRLETVIRHLILENSILRSFQNFKMCSIMHLKLKTSQSPPDCLGSDAQCTQTNFLWGKTFKRHNKLSKVLLCLHQHSKYLIKKTVYIYTFHWKIAYNKLSKLLTLSKYYKMHTYIDWLIHIYAWVSIFLEIIFGISLVHIMIGNLFFIPPK